GGDRVKAAELTLALYHMSTDVSEPMTGGLVGYLIGVSGHCIAIESLRYWLRTGGGDPSYEIELARRLAEDGRRMPPPSDAIPANFATTQRAFERARVSDPSRPEPMFLGMPPLAIFPGLRMRVYRGVVDDYPRLLGEMGSAMDIWDFGRLEQVM